MALRIPLVKLDITLNDERTSRVALHENDLNISCDGQEVYLRHETIERVCRHAKKIDNSVKLDILYFNEKEGDKLEKFPKELFVAKLT